MARADVLLDRARLAASCGNYPRATRYLEQASATAHESYVGARVEITRAYIEAETGDPAAALERCLQVLALGDLDPVAVKIFNRERTIVWASDLSLVGSVSRSGELGEALEGEVVSEFAHSHDDSSASESGDTQLLGISRQGVLDGIKRKRFQAEKVGREWTINRASLRLRAGSRG